MSILYLIEMVSIEELSIQGKAKSKISKRSRKVPWSKTEVDAVMGFFMPQIKKAQIPSKKDCIQCIQNNSSLSQTGRHWKNIKDCVRALNNTA